MSEIAREPIHESKATLLLPALALATFLVHIAALLAGGYGYFRDELYYIACTNRLDIGYVDHPPLSIWLLAVNRWALGDAIPALRLLPAITHGLIVYLTGTLAFRFGGARFAQGLAALSAALAPVIIGMTSIYNMNPYEILLWLVCLHIIHRLLVTGNARLWYLLGFLLGLGSLNKISMLWIGFGIVVAVVLTGERKWLRTPHPYAAALLALAVFAPFVMWNFSHDFAHVEFMRRAAALKYASQNPLTFLSGILMIANPPAVILLIGGLIFLLRDNGLRFFGWIVLAVLAILLVNYHSKPDYFTPALPLLFAAGALWLERLLQRSGRFLRGYAYAGLILVCGIAVLPLTLDILPLPLFIRYSNTLGLSGPSTENHQLPGLPQHYADRFGWREMADSVAVVYHRLPEADRKSCVIVGRNYGEAAAMEFFGKAYGFPPVMAQHNSYFYWGLNEYRDQQVFIIISRTEADFRSMFTSVERAGSTFAEHAMPYENGRGIWICRGPLKPLREGWMLGKEFI